MFCKNRLVALRKNKNLLQKEIAGFLRVGVATYSKYETGDILPPVDIVVMLAKFFNVSTDYLLGTSTLANNCDIPSETLDKALEQAEEKSKMNEEKRELEVFLAQYNVTDKKHIQMLRQQIELMAKVEHNDSMTLM